MSKKTLRLTVERVVDTALACVAADGLDGLTMRGVATRLESSPMALYRHVADREELVARTVDATLAGIELPPHPEPAAARSWLTTMARTVRQRLLTYPGTANHLLVNGPTGPHTMLLMDRVCHVLADTGRGPQEVAWAYDWLMSTVAVYIAKQNVLDRNGGGRKAANAFSARTTAYTDRLAHLRPVAAAFTGDMEAAFDRVVGAVIDAVLDADALRAAG